MEEKEQRGPRDAAEAPEPAKRWLPESPAWTPGASAAHEAFRTDPYARLALMCALWKRQGEFRQNNGSPQWWAPALAGKASRNRVLMALSHLYAQLRPDDPYAANATKEQRAEKLERYRAAARSEAERLDLPKESPAWASIEDGLDPLNGPGRPPEEARALNELFCHAMSSSWTSAPGPEEFESLMRQGERALALWSADADLPSALRADKEACASLCALVAGGCGELDLFHPDDLAMEGRYDFLKFKPWIGGSHPLAAFMESAPEGRDRFAALKAMLMAMGGADKERGASAREALGAMARAPWGSEASVEHLRALAQSTQESGKDGDEWGRVMLLHPLRLLTELKRKRELFGGPERGSEGRDESLGAGDMSAIKAFTAKNEEGLRKRALRAARAGAKLAEPKSAVGEASSRAVFGVLGQCFHPEMIMEEALAKNGRGYVHNKRSQDRGVGASIREKEKGWRLAGQSKDPMEAVALAAAKVFDLDGGDVHGVVGEAKRALMARAGLSEAAWKSLSARPKLRESLERSLKKEAESPRGPSAAWLLESLAKGLSDPEAWMSRDARRLRNGIGPCAEEREDDPLEAQAMARSISACAARGVGANGQELLCAALEKSSKLRALACGRLPCLPEDCERGNVGTVRLDELEDERARVEALGPAFLAGAAKALDRAHAKALGSGASVQDAWESAVGAAVEEASDMCDAFAKGAPGFWGRVEDRNPWEGARREHRKWVADLAKAKMRSNPELGKSWVAILGSLEAGTARASELCNGMDLFDDGMAMRHCVSSYALACQEGRSRIFSIRVSEKRASTLELAPADKSGSRVIWDEDDPASISAVAQWIEVQHRGKRNARVASPQALACAAEVGKAANERWASLSSAMMDNARRKLKKDDREAEPKASGRKFKAG